MASERLTNASGLHESITQQELELINSRAFPSSTLAEKPTQIKSGRFNTTYKLDMEGGASFILRIAPGSTSEVYAHEQQLLRREYAIHPFLSSVARYVPRILFADFTRQLIGRDYTIQSFIEGTDWEQSASELSPQQEVDLWNQLSDISEQINQEGQGFGLPHPCSSFPNWKIALAKILTFMIHDLEKYSLEAKEPKRLLDLIYKDKRYLD